MLDHKSLIWSAAERYVGRASGRGEKHKVKMRIRIDKVTGVEVRFSCTYGKGIGFSAHGDPEEGALWDVEINVLTTLMVGVNVFISHESKQFIRIEGNQTVFCVRVESVDEDEVWLRLSDDFVLTVDEIKGDVTIGDMLQVRLKPEELAIYMIGS